MDYYEENSFVCNACQCEIASDEERSQHYRSPWHRFNVKRKCAGLVPISSELFHERFDQLKQKEKTSTAPVLITCPYTKKTFKTQAAYDRFQTTSTYRRAVEHQQRKEQGIDGKNTGATANLKVDMENKEDDDEVESDNEATSSNAPITMEAEEDEDGNILEARSAIPLRSDLFSSRKPFKSTKACLEYMFKKHGFYIPFVDYLVDLEGLLEYLGAKIGLGRVCIYCNKTFASVESVQRHMVDLGHCMINLHDREGKEDDDLKQFWRFNDTSLLDEWDAIDEEDDEDVEDEIDEEYEEDMDENIEDDIEDRPEIKMSKEEYVQLREQQRLRTMQLLGIPVTDSVTDGVTDTMGDSSTALIPVQKQGKRSIADMNEAGELILTDGTVVGHRSLLRKYNKRPVLETAKSKLRKQLIATYYNLGLAGYAVERKEEVERKKVMAKSTTNWLRHVYKVGIQQNDIRMKYFHFQTPKVKSG